MHFSYPDKNVQEYEAFIGLLIRVCAFVDVTERDRHVMARRGRFFVMCALCRLTRLCAFLVACVSRWRFLLCTFSNSLARFAFFLHR